MSSRAGRAARAGRGLAAASLATFVATLSHASVAAQVPPLVNIVLALCLAAPVCVALAGRSLSWWRLGAAVVLSQGLFHALLALDLQSGGATVAGHHGGVAVLLDATASAHSPDAHASDNPWMWAAHAVAAIVTVVALGRGERAIQAITRFVVAALRALRPFRGLEPETGDAANLAPASPLLPQAMTVLSPMRHRGPPLAA